MTLDFIYLLAELHGNLSFGVAAAGAGIGIGLVGVGAAQAVGRNPGAFGSVLTISLICMALAEAIAIFGLVIVLTQADIVKQEDGEGEAQQEEVQTQ